MPPKQGTWKRKPSRVLATRTTPRASSPGCRATSSGCRSGTTRREPSQTASRSFALHRVVRDAEHGPAGAGDEADPGALPADAVPAARPDGKPRLSFRSQHVRLTGVRGFFKWLTRQNVLPSNPASELELPRLPDRLPRDVLTATRSSGCWSSRTAHGRRGPGPRDPRDAVLDGHAAQRLSKLCIYDVDTERGTLMVRQGKGRKDRMVPIGERALAWVDRYCRDVRPELVVPPDRAGSS